MDAPKLQRRYLWRDWMREQRKPLWERVFGTVGPTVSKHRPLQRIAATGYGLATLSVLVGNAKSFDGSWPHAYGFSSLLLYTGMLGLTAMRARARIGAERRFDALFSLVILHAAVGLTATAVLAATRVTVGVSAHLHNWAVGFAFFGVLLGFIPGLALRTAGHRATPLYIVGLAGTIWLLTLL